LFGFMGFAVYMCCRTKTTNNYQQPLINQQPQQGYGGQGYGGAAPQAYAMPLQPRQAPQPRRAPQAGNHPAPQNFPTFSPQPQAVHLSNATHGEQELGDAHIPFPRGVSSTRFPCEFRVVAAETKVRAGPALETAQVSTIRRGDVVTATEKTMDAHGNVRVRVGIYLGTGWATWIAKNGTVLMQEVTETAATPAIMSKGPIELTAPSSGSPQFCSQCGSALGVSAKFCPECGTSAVAASPAH
jgi:hypothetical protein